MPYYAKVILDSTGPQGIRLTTMEFTLPKLWLAEFNTHCMFARNSASTRAIPYKKQRQLTVDDSFIPFEWPVEGKGMAHSETITDHRVMQLDHIWKEARDAALRSADYLVATYGIHKQLAGRLLEPWRFQTILVTGDAASYANFFHLRRDQGAAPEIHKAADLMWEAYSSSTPKYLVEGDWHTPLLREDDPAESIENLCKISAARCARLSYLTQHGVRDIIEDMNLFERLTLGGHWSPLEHVCQAMPACTVPDDIFENYDVEPKRYSKWFGWRSLRSTFPGEYITKYSFNKDTNAYEIGFGK